MFYKQLLNDRMLMILQSEIQSPKQISFSILQNWMCSRAYNNQRRAYNNQSKLLSKFSKLKL